MQICLIGAGYVGTALLHSWKGTNDRFIATTTTKEKLSKIRQAEKVDKAMVLKIEAETRVESLIAGCDGVVVTIAPTKGAGYRETYLESAKVITEQSSSKLKKCSSYIRAVLLFMVTKKELKLMKHHKETLYQSKAKFYQR